MLEMVDHIEEGGVVVLIFEHNTQFECVIQLLAVERILSEDGNGPLLVTQRGIAIQRPDEEELAVLFDPEVVRVEAGADGELDLLRLVHDAGVVVGIPGPDRYDRVHRHRVLHDPADRLVLDQELGLVVVHVDDRYLQSTRKKSVSVSALLRYCTAL